MGAVAGHHGCMSESEQVREIDVDEVQARRVREQFRPGWISRGRCPVDANMVHVEESIATEQPGAMRVEVVEGTTPLAGMVVTPTEFGPDTTVDRDHACGVPATRVGPGESPLAVDD